jgi:hypothetical protein
MNKNVLFYMRTLATVLILCTFWACGDEEGDDPPKTPETGTPTPPPVVDTDAEVTIVYGDQAIGLKETSVENVYADTVDFAADATFNVQIGNAVYGFLPYSGNGGIGTITNTYATLPVYNGGVYVIDKSRGRLTAESPEALYVATGSGGKVYVEIDLSNADAIPRYYLRLLDNDPNILLKESFDLFVWGGDWVQNKSGSFITGSSGASPLLTDGTEAAASINAGTRTVVGSTALKSEVTPDYDASVFLRNRDLAGWTMANIYEMASYIRLSVNSSDPAISTHGIIKTPPLTALTATANITVEFDICRFSSTGDIAFRLEGAGTIVSGEYGDVDTPTGPFPLTEPATKVLITTNHAQSWMGMNNLPKYFTHFKFNVTGANATTRIVWSGHPDDTGAVTVGGDVRVCLNDVLIKK